MEEKDIERYNIFGDTQNNNVNPLPQETANNMNQNSNYMQGGSTFVMNGQVPNNQNNNNWNL